MDQDTEAAAEPFTIFDVLGDAWGSFTRTFTTHLRWNAAYIGILVLSSCVMACALTPVVFASMSLGSEAAGPIAVGGVLIAYGLFLVFGLVLVALHQGVSLAITAADLGGQPTSLATALDAARPRALPMLGALLARFAIDFSVGVVLIGGVTFAALGPFGQDLDDAESVARMTTMLPLFFVAYAATLAWAIVTRAFVGLSGPVVQHEARGPLASIARSAELLTGRRAHMVGLRVLWALVAGVLYVVSYVPMLLFLSAGQAGSGGELVVLLTFPYAIVWYLFVLHILSFDSVLEGAFYARVTRKAKAEELARVFT